MVFLDGAILGIHRRSIITGDSEKRLHAHFFRIRALFANRGVAMVFVNCATLGIHKRSIITGNS